MFLLKEHCITPSSNLQAISSRVSYKHTQWVFTALSKDLLKIRYDQNPDLFNFLSLRSSVHVLSAVSLFFHFLLEEHKKYFLPVCPLPTWQKYYFYFKSKPHNSSSQLRNVGRCTNCIQLLTHSQSKTLKKQLASNFLVAKMQQATWEKYQLTCETQPHRRAMQRT